MIKETYLKLLASGDKLGAFSLSEPQSGSDASNMHTQAIKKGDYYIINGIKKLTTLNNDQLMAEARDLQAPFPLVEQVSKIGRLPVPNFSAGGIATPADVSLVMQLGASAVFVGSGIFKSEDPPARAKAIVESATYFQDPKKIAEVSTGLKSAMIGLDISKIPEDQMFQERGW